MNQVERLSVEKFNRQESSTPGTAWRLLAILTLLNVVNFVDRQMITSLQIPLKDDPQLQLSITNNQWLAGYAFSVVYSIAGLLLGSWADRSHRPRLIAMGLLIWSAATAASGLAQNFWQLALARVFVAFGESTLTPAAVAMLADVFLPRQRSLASGIYYLGIPIGSGLCLIVANMLSAIPWLGWRGCFFLLGLVGLFMVGVMLLVKDPPRGASEIGAEVRSPQSNTRKPIGQIFREIIETLTRTPALALTILGAIFINIAVGTTWLDSSWLNAERGFSKQGAPIFLGCVFLFGGTTGSLLGGWLGDWFNRFRPGGRLLAIVVLQLAIVPFAIAFRFLPGDNLFGLAVCCFFSSILVTVMYGPVLATIQELSPVPMRATMLAVLMIGLNVAGASLGSVAAAKLSTFMGSFTWGIFFTAQAGLIAIPLFLLAIQRYELDLKRVAMSASSNFPGH